jgi:hypothetical protein
MATRRFARMATCALALAAAMLASACAPRGNPTGYPDRDTLTAEEMVGVQDQTLRQVIQRFRPQWLVLRRGRTLSNAEPPPLVVYLNDSRMGGETLDRMVAAEIVEMRYMDSIDATQRYGTGHGSGAILITAR